MLLTATLSIKRLLQIFWNLFLQNLIKFSFAQISGIMTTVYFFHFCINCRKYDHCLTENRNLMKSRVFKTILQTFKTSFEYPSDMKYRRPSLFAGLVFAQFWLFAVCFLLPKFDIRGFPPFIRGFDYFCSAFSLKSSIFTDISLLFSQLLLISKILLRNTLM